MFRSASRSFLRGTTTPQLRLAQGRRFISNASASSQKSESWRSTVVRWSLAAGAVYYYNTSTVFAEEPSQPVSLQTASTSADDNASLPTIESVAAAKKRKPSPAPPRQETQPKPEPSIDSSISASTETEFDPSEAQPLELSPDELEQEAGQEGAFNPETGEINWDCPCLGGMAHGPCGEDFRTAFSCFVFSTEEPKGIECIEKFKGMQDCFRLHPDVYGGEIDDDEVDTQLDDHIAAEKANPSSDVSKTASSVQSAVDDQKETESGLAKEKVQQAIAQELDSGEPKVPQKRHASPDNTDNKK